MAVLQMVWVYALTLVSLWIVGVYVRPVLIVAGMPYRKDGPRLRALMKCYCRC